MNRDRSFERQAPWAGQRPGRSPELQKYPRSCRRSPARAARQSPGAAPRSARQSGQPPQPYPHRLRRYAAPCLTPAPPPARRAHGRGRPGLPPPSPPRPVPGVEDRVLPGVHGQPGAQLRRRRCPGGELCRQTRFPVPTRSHRVGRQRNQLRGDPVQLDVVFSVPAQNRLNRLDVVAPHLIQVGTPFRRLHRREPLGRKGTESRPGFLALQAQVDARIPESDAQPVRHSHLDAELRGTPQVRSPRRTASATAAARLLHPSLANSAFMCRLTVRSLRYIPAPISP